MIGIPRELLGQDLDSHLTFELRITRTTNLSHAAFAEQRSDFVRTKLSADGHGHRDGRDYSCIQLGQQSNTKRLFLDRSRGQIEEMFGARSDLQVKPVSS